MWLQATGICPTNALSFQVISVLTVCVLKKEMKKLQKNVKGNVNMRLARLIHFA